MIDLAILRYKSKLQGKALENSFSESSREMFSWILDSRERGDVLHFSERLRLLMTLDVVRPITYQI